MLRTIFIIEKPGGKPGDGDKLVIWTRNLNQNLTRYRIDFPKVNLEPSRALPWSTRSPKVPFWGSTKGKIPCAHGSPKGTPGWRRVLRTIPGAQLSQVVRSTFFRVFPSGALSGCPRGFFLLAFRDHLCYLRPPCKKQGGRR